MTMSPAALERPYGYLSSPSTSGASGRSLHPSAPSVHVRSSFGSAPYVASSLPGNTEVSHQAHKWHYPAQQPASSAEEDEEMPFDEGNPSNFENEPGPTPRVASVVTTHQSDVETLRPSTSVSSSRNYYSETDDSYVVAQQENQASPSMKITSGVSPVKVGRNSSQRKTSSHQSVSSGSNHPNETTVTSVNESFASYHTSDQSAVWEKPIPPHNNYEDFGHASITEGSVTTGASSQYMMSSGHPLATKGFKYSMSDEDSIFNFEDEARPQVDFRGSTLGPVPPRSSSNGPRSSPKKTTSGRNRKARRGRRIDMDQVTDDDTSIDNDYGMVRPRTASLQARARKAFQSRSNKRQLSPGDPPPKKGFSVSFGTENVIHEFQPPIDDYDSCTIGTATSFSEYSKSMESEVEDAFKDLFFIGSSKKNIPGRRKSDQDADGDGTVNSSNDDSVTLNTLEEGDRVARPIHSDRVARPIHTDSQLPEVVFKKEAVSSPNPVISNPSPVKVTPEIEKKSPRQSIPSPEDTFGAVWTAVEESVNTFSAALGLSPTSSQKQGSSAPQAPKEASSAPDATLEISAVTSSVNAKNPVDRASSPSRSTPSTASSSTSPPKEGGRSTPLNEILEYAHEIIVKSFSGGDGSPHEKAQSTTPPPRFDDKPIMSDVTKGLTPVMESLSEEASSTQQPPKESVSRERNQEDGPLLLENDPRLLQLALSTCRSFHRLHGKVFDDQSDEDVITMVEFAAAKISLPLGLLFQENEGGCWVAKVFPNGNAERADEDGVKIGDQLASINGISCIELKVDDICDLISTIDKSEKIDLIFLRYKMPLRPLCVIHEEGYEIEASPEITALTEERMDQNTSHEDNEENARISRHSPQSDSSYLVRNRSESSGSKTSSQFVRNRSESSASKTSRTTTSTRTATKKKKKNQSIMRSDTPATVPMPTRKSRSFSKLFRRDKKPTAK